MLDASHFRKKLNFISSISMIFIIVACVPLNENIANRFPEKVQGIPSSDAWYAGEITATEEVIGQKYNVRRGITPTGYSYSIFDDWSAGVGPDDAHWSITCKLDAISDQKKCTIANYKNHIFIDYRGTPKPQTICIISHDFPGRTGAIRVGNNAPHNTDTDGCISAKHLNELVNGSEVTVRFVKWPDDAHVDLTAPLSGINDAVSLTSYIYEKLPIKK